MRELARIDIKAMDPYQRYAYKDMMQWIRKHDRGPGILNSITSSIQKRINRIIPGKVHTAITVAVREVIKTLMLGTRFLSPKPQHLPHLKYIEDAIRTSITAHKRTAAAEGGLTGAGGFLWSIADFPLLLGIKIKLMQDIAALHGKDGSDTREKFFLLLVLQAAFSSDGVRRETLYKILNFEQLKEELPEKINKADWLTLQQQYRDYLDIAKLLQMLPVIGAAVGTIVNYRLVSLLGKTALQCYRIRYFQSLQS